MKNGTNSTATFDGNRTSDASQPRVPAATASSAARSEPLSHFALITRARDGPERDGRAPRQRPRPSVASRLIALLLFIAPMVRWRADSRRPAVGGRADDGSGARMAG